MIGTILSAIGSTLVGMLMKIITGPALETLMLQGLEQLVKSTDSKVDDELFKTVKEAVQKKD